MAFRRHRQDEFDAELESHIDLHTADNIRAGMSPDEARRQALIALGGVAQTKQIYRERRRIPMLEEALQDARFGIRTLRKNPGLTLIAVLSLALATGATTAIFSVVYSVALRPLPFAEPNRLVQIAETAMLRDDLESLRRQSHAFESFAEYSPATRHLHTSLERRAHHGRRLRSRSVRGAGRAAARRPHVSTSTITLVAVISEPLWRSRFASDPNVIGGHVTLDDQSFTVVGVMPEAFQFPYGAASVLRSATSEARVDVWIAEYRPLRGRLSAARRAAETGRVPGCGRRRDRSRRDASSIARHRAEARARAGGAVRRCCSRSDAPGALPALRRRGAGAHHGMRKRREPAAGAHEQQNAGGRDAERRSARPARASCGSS